MKRVILLFFAFQICFASCQTKEDLYLLFKEKRNKMYISKYSSSRFKIFTYNVNNKRDFVEIYFNSEISKEHDIYAKKNGKYKTKLHQKTIPLQKLKKYDVKDYTWLEKNINLFNFYHQNFRDDIYDKMHIVEIDSMAKKATITEVSHVEIIE